MNTILIGLGLGLAAGVLDTLPMIIQKLPLPALISAFTQWLFMGVVITTCNLGLPGWLTGLILGVAGAIPLILIAVTNPAMTPAGSEMKTAAIILANSIVLGTGIGFFSRLIMR